MDFFVYSRQAIEAIEPHEVSHVIVSITTPGDPGNTRLPLNKHTQALLTLEFYDVDRIVNGYNDHLERRKVFNKEHASLIRKFATWNQQVERFIVHCDAGMSRSPAVAAAVSKMLYGDDMRFFKRYTGLNRRVYHMILDQEVIHPTSAWGTSDD